MKLKFLGGVEGVTGSKTLLTVGMKEYLIDYGLFQGGSKIREGNWTGYDWKELSAVFLTHAHIDHSGLIPRLLRYKFRGKIYCTKETFKLCEILLADSAKIHVEDAEYANRKQYSRHKPALPLYTPEDVEEVLKQFQTVDFGEEILVSENVSIKFHWAGHILGASFIEIKAKEGEVDKTIVFSGDLGHKRAVLLKGPEKLVPCDLLVLESTYGNKLHARMPAEEILSMYLNVILKREGVAIIPSFSVGRTQDILHLINILMRSKKIPDVPVILDSPLSRKANKIFLENMKSEFIKKEVIDCCEEEVFPKNLFEVETIEESTQAQQRGGPVIIVSASGMMDGGRVVHHVKKRVSDRKNGIILVGFQPEGTKGRLLIDGIKTLRLHKQEFPVKASIFYINSLSAHGDYLDLIEWLKESQVKPELTILNHGEVKGAENFKALLETTLEFKTTIAEYCEEFVLV